MLYESKTLELSCEGSVATLVLHGAGLAELRHSLDLVRRNPFLEILLIRGAHPNAFDGDCFRLTDHDEDGLQFLREFEAIPVVTLALLTGPCRGGGLELALACDYRIATATPDSWYELGTSTRWGGIGRFYSLTGQYPGTALTAREANNCGLIDHVFSLRREKIELRTWLDRLVRSPRKRKLSWWRSRIRRRIDLRELERIPNTSPANRSFVPKLSQPIRTICSGLELRDCPQAVPLAITYLLHGGTVCVDEPSDIRSALAEIAKRGTITPLELEKIQKRILPPGSVSMPWVFTGTANNPLSIVTVSIRPFSQPVRLGFSPLPENHHVEVCDGHARRQLTRLLDATGYEAVVVPDQAELSVRPLLARFWDEAVRLVAEGYPIDLIDEVSDSVSHFPPLRTMDRIGMDHVTQLVPRLRVFTELGLDAVFYHPDHPEEPNTLAQAMLGFGPRMNVDEDLYEEPNLDELQNQIRQRLTQVINEQDRVILQAAGFKRLQTSPVNVSSLTRTAA